MSNTANINTIIQEIESLDYNSKINVMSKIVSMLKRAKAKPTALNITKLKGLGKDIWEDVHVESYLAKEREAWD